MRFVGIHEVWGVHAVLCRSLSLSLSLSLSSLSSCARYLGVRFLMILWLLGQALEPCTIYLYDHSSSDKEIVGRGPGRGEKVNDRQRALAACLGITSEVNEPVVAPVEMIC